MPRGRKSEAAQFQGGPFIPAQRPEPPADLQPPEAADEWRTIVNRMPTEWFTEENFGLLSELCAHLVYAKRIRSGIERVKQACELEGKDWVLDDEYSVKLRRMWQEHRYQSQQIASLATKLRLPIQSRYSPQTAEDEREKVAATVGRKPWEWRDEVRQ